MCTRYCRKDSCVCATQGVDSAFKFGGEESSRSIYVVWSTTDKMHQNACFVEQEGSTTNATEEFRVKCLSCKVWSMHFVEYSHAVHLFRKEVLWVHPRSNVNRLYVGDRGKINIEFFCEEYCRNEWKEMYVLLGENVKMG